MVEDLGTDYCLCAAGLSDEASPDPARMWELVDADHYDLNTCLREAIVLLKSFLLVLPADQLGAFQQTILEQSGDGARPGERAGGEFEVQLGKMVVELRPAERTRAWRSRNFSGRRRFAGVRRSSSATTLPTTASELMIARSHVGEVVADEDRRTPAKRRLPRNPRSPRPCPFRWAAARRPFSRAALELSAQLARQAAHHLLTVQE